MQPTNNNNNLIVKLMISPRLRIVRHLILFICILAISAGMVWYVEDEGIHLDPSLKYGGLLFFITIFLGACYINIYILVPRLLLKNKWILFFCSLLGMVVFIIIASILFQEAFFKSSLVHPVEQDTYTSYLSGFVNLLSSTLSIFLLFMGTTTIILFKYWILDMKQSEELKSATLQVELKMLENQINPHFLFNMLNNANIMIKKDPDTASHIIKKLEEMLRYQMDENTGERVYLKEEILFLNDFLELEKTRRDYFSYDITEENGAGDIMIPPLLFITFVENAVKHSQDSRIASYVNISFNKTGQKLIFICENSIPKNSPTQKVGGIGLLNIRRRLDLLFENKYSLEQVKTDAVYTIKLELAL